MTEQTPITDRTIGEYLKTLGSSRPDPGGGSVAGLVGALGAALGQMVISLTVTRTPHPQFDERSAALAQAIAALLASAEADERAYAGYLQATRLPKSSDPEKAARRDAMQAAVVNAAEVPLQLATSAGQVLNLLDLVASEGTSHALSDAEIGVSLAEASVLAGLANVRINIPLIKEAAVAADLARRADQVEATARQRAAALRGILANRQT
jgi:formiminotetrahydrofolate cyclodeaminase